MNKNTADASIYYNGDFFEFVTMSRGMLGYADPDAPPSYLTPDATNEKLGSAVRDALSSSKRISVSDFQALFKSGVVQKTQKEREIAVIHRYGYKSRRAVYLNMLCCWISAFDEVIQIQPTLHDSLDGYKGISKDGPEILRIPRSATDTELGTALKEGFRRCTSKWPE